MDEDKVIVAYRGFWDGCTYKNGLEEMIFVPLLKISLEAFLDHVHKIVGADQAIVKYALYCLVSHENRPVKWKILPKQNLERAKTMFNTPKFFVVEQKKLPTSSPPINGGQNFTNIGYMKHLMPSQGVSGCKKLPTSSPPINQGKNFSNISNMKHLTPLQGASGCNFPTSNGGNSRPRFPELSIPPYFYRARPSFPPVVKTLVPNALAQNMAKSNKTAKVVEGQNAGRHFGSFGDDMLCPDALDPAVGDSPCRGLGLNYGRGEKNDLSYEPEEDEDSTDDEDYSEDESFEEVVSKMVYDHFGWEHDDYFIREEDVLQSWPHPTELVHEEAVIGDIHERVLRNRSIPMESTFEKWRPMALSQMLDPVVVPRAYEAVPIGESEMMSDGSGGKIIICSRCWNEGHSRVNCTSSVSLSSPSTDPGFWSSDEVAMMKPKRRCGICREVGHTRRSCAARD